MTESSPKWRSLHFYQQVKYVAEIVAIFGGLFLLGLNVYQVRLLSQSVEINRQLYNSSFPLEVQSNLVDYVDGKPLVIRLKVTNVIGRRMKLLTWMVRVVRTGSNTIEDDFRNTTIGLVKGRMKVPAPSNQGADRQIILKASESCILELSTKLDIPEYSQKDSFDHKSKQAAAFIVVPVWIESFNQFTSKIIFLSLWRDKNRSLHITPDILREMDDNTLMMIARIKRAQLSVPEPNEY